VVASADLFYASLRSLHMAVGIEERVGGCCRSHHTGEAPQRQLQHMTAGPGLPSRDVQNVLPCSSPRYSFPVVRAARRQRVDYQTVSNARELDLHLLHCSVTITPLDDTISEC